MLHSAEDNLILAADQVLAKISPNVSVEAMAPDSNPLGLYLRSLRALKRRLPEDVLVLPGHNLPFVGLQRARGRTHQRTTRPAAPRSWRRAVSRRRPWPNWCRSFSAAGSTTRINSCSPSARRWHM